MKKKILNQLIVAALVCGSILAVGNIPANAEIKTENAIQISETNKEGTDSSRYGAHNKIKNGKLYYCNESDQETGWVHDVGGKMYYYNEKGEMQKNTTVKDLTGKEVKLNEKGVVVGEHGYDLIIGEEVTYDSSEAYKKSHKQWKKVGNDWYYYFGNNLEVKIADSWQLDNGIYYYFNHDGKMQKNTTVKSAKGNDCVLNADGALTNRSTPDIAFDDDYSWTEVNGNRYYMDSIEDKETGWIHDNATGKWYYCNDDGVMQKNTTVKDEKGNDCVLNLDGALTNRSTPDI